MKCEDVGTTNHNLRRFGRTHVCPYGHPHVRPYVCPYVCPYVRPYVCPSVRPYVFVWLLRGLSSKHVLHAIGGHDKPVSLNRSAFKQKEHQ